MVVLIARSYVAFDASNRFRKIFSPGAMKPFGISFLDGIPTEVHVSGTELDTVIKGPSTDAYLFDAVGHAIKCPHITTHPSLSVLPILDHTDEGVAELIQELTMAEVQVLIAAGADRRADGWSMAVSLTPINTFRSSIICTRCLRCLSTYNDRWVRAVLPGLRLGFRRGPRNLRARILG